MVFFAKADGTVVASVLSGVNQGSHNANEILFVAPFPVSTVMTASFITANGIPVSERIMTLVAPQNLPPELSNPNSTAHVWAIQLTAAVTEFAGNVTAQFRAYSSDTVFETNPDDGTLVITVGTGAHILATSSVVFPVAKGTPGTLPVNPTPDAWEEVLAYISTILADLGDKVDKLTTAGTWAYTHTGATQGETKVDPDAASANTIPKRTASGAIFTGTATANAHAVPKSQMDTALAGKRDIDYPSGVYDAAYVSRTNDGQDVVDLVPDAGDGNEQKGAIPIYDALRGLLHTPTPPMQGQTGYDASAVPNIGQILAQFLRKTGSGTQTIGGNLVLSGNLTVQGTTTTTEEETVQTGSAFIVTNNGGAEIARSGIIIRGGGDIFVDTFFGYDFIRDTLGVGFGTYTPGEGGAEGTFVETDFTALALRADSDNLPNGALLSWDASSYTLVNSGHTSAQITAMVATIASQAAKITELENALNTKVQIVGEHIDGTTVTFSLVGSVE